MSLPHDPVILLSYVNTQLRDNYSSLAEFCKANDVDMTDLKIRLKEINYEYDDSLNRFM